MKRISRDNWLGIGLIVVLVGVLFAAGLQQAGEEQLPAYTSSSSAPDGTHALALWLEDIGYAVDAEPSNTFSLPQGTTITLLLEPSETVTSDEWDVLDKWIENGGVLIVAGDDFGTLLAASHFDFELRYLAQSVEALTLQAPLLVSPPDVDTVKVQARAVLSTDRADYVTHLAAGAQPVAVSFRQGAGTVFLVSAPIPFSNQGLKQPGNPAFVLSMLWVATTGRKVWFDEWHHGIRGSENAVVGPGNWLASTPAGRSLLYAAVIIFVALLLQGRQFGRAVPAPHERARRSPLEYITAIANLNRRAGHRAAVMEDYHQRLKRAIGHRYRLSPTLDDAEFIRTLAAYDTGLNTEELGRLLARLTKPGVSENELIDLAAHASIWLDERKTS
jgi:hypothetical protein